MSDIVERLRATTDGASVNPDGPEAADEIDRLRAGGCARDQTTTQFCAEAALLAADNDRLRAAIECALRQLADGMTVSATGTLSAALEEKA